MHNSKYFNRLVEKKINEGFEVIQVLCIEGIKYCGKTSTCERIAKTVFKFQDLGKKDIYRTYIYSNNDLLFSHPNPVLFDKDKRFLKFEIY
ncbi:MAG: hypothetical protein LBB39_02940 [Mycoplasmataceae bacterium]|nr:hypothetical protein [Mycoplasmataceae bacterium]